MSLTSVINIANTGLQAAQTGLGVVSDNIANIGTTGYVRKVVDQQSLAVGGVGMGVTVAQIATTADRYLEATSRSAGSDQGKADVQSSFLDQAQALFGDPNGGSSSADPASSGFFSSLNTVFTGFISLAASPGAAAAGQAVSQVQSFFDQASNVSAGLDALSTQADGQIGGDVTQINSLLSQVDALNTQISRGGVSGGDVSGAQDQQSQALDQLSALISVSVAPSANGGVVVRASNGASLVNQFGAATVNYDTSSSPSGLTIAGTNGLTQTLGDGGSGAVAGLLAQRNTQIPAIKSQLSELVSQTAAQLNSVHNGYSAVPPPTSLTGRNTGLDQTTALSDFAGKTTVAITNASGVAATSVAIDFDAGTLTVGGATSNFTPASFTTQLNAALGSSGSASFANGALTISAASSANGVVVADDPTTPSSRGGQSFSAYLGLNDLVTSGVISNYNTGLTTSDANGFAAGGQLSLQLTKADGTPLTTAPITITTTGSGTIGDLLNQLNSNSGGLGLYGSFALDPAGALSFTPNAASGASAQVSVASDTTQWTSTGTSASTLFGIGDATRGTRLGGFQVRSDIAADPTKLAVATYNPSGSPPLSSADSSGADALAQAANTTVGFAATGNSAAASTSLTDFAANVASTIAQQAANATTKSSAADSVKTEADSRRTSVEGVNLDQELVSLTTYQEAYSASARMIQAAKDMFDALLQIVP